MEIRVANQKDENAVNEFYKKVIDVMHYNHFNFPRWDYEVYPSKETIANAISKGEQFICLDKDVIVGAFVLNKDPEGEYQKYGDWTIHLDDGQYYVIHTFAVDPDYTRNGVAHIMINYIKQKAMDEYIPSIRCDIMGDNRPAISLFERNCFKYVGEGTLGREYIIGVKDFKLYEYNL